MLNNTLLIIVAELSRFNSLPSFNFLFVNKRKVEREEVVFKCAAVFCLFVCLVSCRVLNDWGQ